MSTGYASGMRRDRIAIMNRKESVVGKFGRDSGGIEWETVAAVWAAVDWAKGMRSLNAGALDAYGVVLVRMNWTEKVTKHSRIRHDGVTYQILPETFHSNRQCNIVQFNAQAVVNEE